MAKLPGILERLSDPNVSRVELGQREAFLELMADARLRAGSRALSVSCGAGIWDYLALSGPFGVDRVDATDIVACPVRQADEQTLRSLGEWHFRRVDPDGKLPFDDAEFDVAFHQDVVEHTTRPYRFMKEQHRVLRQGGTVIVGTPNLLRPMNLLKALAGRLQFPSLIGHDDELGDYVHVQEFHTAQLQLLLEEVGFTNVTVRHVYFGLSMTNICISLFPERRVGQTFAHFLMARGVKG